MSVARLIAVLLLVFAVLLPSTAQAADIGAVGSQLRLTKIGADGDASVDANSPTIAYNSRDDEFLIAWVGNTSAAVEDEILGQILDRNGVPKGNVQALSAVPDAEAAPAQPVLGYSPAVNQYVLGYVATPLVITPAPPNSPAGQREVIAQAVTATGVRSGNPARISETDDTNADADQASDPAMAYDPGRDQFRFVWVTDHLTEGDFEVRSRRVSSSLVNPDAIAEVAVSSLPAGDADDPTIAYLPTPDRWAIVWEGATAAAETEIFLEMMNAVTGGQAVAQDEISSAAGVADAVKPAVASNPGRGEVLVSFVKNEANEPEAYAQRVLATGAQFPDATDQRISTMGPDGNLALGVSPLRNTTATYHPLLDRYLVTWAADNDLPGLVDNEIERYGQAFDGAGVPVAGDDFRISVAGPDGNDNATADNGATVAIPGKRAWLHVWDGDDNRPPLADNEFEIYGRFAGDDGDLDGFTVPDDCNDANAAIRPGATDIVDNGIDEDCSGADAENLDRDADGSLRPSDCNDADSGIRAGAADIPDNGVDEDCNGTDAVNLDRDGDGSLRPVDCNDGNRNIRPGATDTPRNGIDEDCSGKDAPFPTLTSGVLPAWDVRGSRLTLVSLRITQQLPKGFSVKIFCKGSKCPFKSKSLKPGKVKRGASSVIGSLSKSQRNFRAKQTVEVWVSAPNFNTKISRYALKKGKIPTSQPFCALPGATKPQKSCG